MLNICFGENGDWVKNITNAIDRTLFKFQFCNLRSVDFADFDCIVPLRESDYIALQSNKPYFGTKFWAPDPYVADICDDKLALNRWLLGSDFAELVPPLLTGRHTGFPYVVKKRRDT